MTHGKNITGIVLAGGRSSRMGSDKGLLKLNDKLFIEHIMLAMKPLVDSIIIVSNNNTYDQFGYERIIDEVKDAGPLAGLYSGLSHSKTRYNLVLSCDIPLIQTEVLKTLIDTDYKNYDVVQIQSENKTMPLIALYNKECMDKCLKLLHDGERRLRVAVGQLNTKTVSIQPRWQEYVKNINTKDDLNEITNAVKH